MCTRQLQCFSIFRNQNQCGFFLEETQRGFFMSHFCRTKHYEEWKDIAWSPNRIESRITLFYSEQKREKKLKEQPTLNCPLEESLAGLTGSHSIVVPWCNVTTHQTQSFGHRVQHIFTLGLWIFSNGTGAVVIPFPDRPVAPKPCGWRVEGRWVQPVLMSIHGGTVAPAGVWGATGAVVVDAVRQRGRARRFRLDVRRTARINVSIFAWHSAEKPVVWRERERRICVLKTTLFKAALWKG